MLPKAFTRGTPARLARAGLGVACLLTLLSACGGNRSGEPAAQPDTEETVTAPDPTNTESHPSTQAPSPWEREQMAIGAQLNAQELATAERRSGQTTAIAPDTATDLQATYRFFNAQTGAHFFTSSAAERDAVVRSLPAFQYEGVAFYTSATPGSGLEPVYRFFGLDTGVHFYTISKAEKAHIEAHLPRLRYEGVAYYASASRTTVTTALNRFYAPARGFHFYTASASEAAHIRATNPFYTWEGLSYHVWASSSPAPSAPLNGSVEVTALPAGFAACADTATQTMCRFSGTQQLHFGVAGRYFTALVSGPFDCAQAASLFGDPAPGEVKECHIEASAILPEGDPGSPPPDPTPTSAARMGQVALAQSMVFPSDDAQLVLVEGKDVLVLAKATTTDTQEAPPGGTLTVEDAAGQTLYSVALTPPTDGVPTALQATPSFAHDYSARLPGAWVRPGLRLKVGLDNGLAATRLAPRVGASNAITLMAIPIQIGSTLATVPAASSDYLRARMPMASVTAPTRATMVSTRVTTVPTTSQGWLNAMYDLLDEITDIRVSEYAQGNVFYYGFFPKRSYGYMGLGYVGYPAAVGADWAYQDLGLQTFVHELGHNTGLPHAPCGGPANPDPNYPYANAALGAGNRFIWGYNATTKTFVDATDSALHDTMSYCNGDTFSDYNYRKIQTNLTPADANALGQSKRSAQPQELLLIGGRIRGEAITLRPPKSFQGMEQPPAPGPYRLRLIGTDATISEHEFAALRVDHDAQTLSFAFSVPHPGALQALEIWHGEQLLLRQESARNATKSGQAMGTLRNKSGSTGQTPPGWQVAEHQGQLTVSWDASAWPYLMVTHVGKQRTTLAVEARGGALSLSLKGVPEGGKFEFSASDGLNSQRWELLR
ncbi:MAG TPA: M66 family metalloprotease [Hydrogenophaga sp.]